MTPDEAATGGMELARCALHAVADGRDDEALAHLSSGTHEETTWAAGYLLSALRESIGARYGGKPVRVALALHKAADDMGEDVMETRLRLFLQALEGGDSNV